MLTDSYRILERKFTDFLRIFYGVKESRLTDCLRILTGFGRGSLRIFYGVKESRLTDCLRILTGFGRGSWIFYGFFTGLRRAGLRIAYGFLPDLEKKVYGFFTDFLRGEGEQAYGLLTDSYRIWERSLRIFYGFLNNVKESRLTDCLRILTGFGRGSLRIFYGFFFLTG